MEGKWRKMGKERGKKGGGGGRKLTTLCTGIKPQERDFVDPILQSKNCRPWELKEITEGQNPSKQRITPNSKDSESCAFSRQPDKNSFPVSSMCAPCQVLGRRFTNAASPSTAGPAQLPLRPRGNSQGHPRDVVP